MHDTPWELDLIDEEWLKSFRDAQGGTIPDDALIEGFISIITWVNPDGSFGWKLYNALERPTSTVVGLLEMAKFDYMSAARGSGEEEDQT